MAIIWVCAAIVVTAVVLGVRWSRLPFSAPAPTDDPTAGDVLQRYTWYCALVLTAGITAGLSIIGCGGRLAMRLLAVTAGDDAQGRITEAEEVVGEVTVDGTIGFVVFNGIFGGVVGAAVYLLIRRLLPPRWAGGLAFGAGLLAVLGTTIDPLRDENPDFDLVGPGWVSVLAFTALALGFGVVLSGFAARLSAWLPLPSTERSTVLRYLPIALIAAVGFTLTIVLVLVGAVVAIVTRWRPVVTWFRSPVALRVGQVLLLAVVAVSVPGALQSVTDIVSR